MPRQPSRLFRIFDPLPTSPVLAQWQLVESAFDSLRAPPVAIYAPVAGGLAAFGLFGQIWCLAWVVCALGAMVLCQRAAAAFDGRTAAPSPMHWARLFRASLWAQAAVLGAGGVGAAVSGNPAVALLIAFPLSFAAARGGATAALAGPARGQAVLILAPLALASLAVGTPIFLALAALATLQAGMAAALAETSAFHAQSAAETAAASPHEPVVGTVTLPKAAADFQKLLGRDQTTGLPNKHSFMHLLAQESTRAFRAETALSLLLVAWDDYDEAARSIGQAALDEQIASIARRLRATLHRQQDLLASLGGGRFAAVLPFTDAFGAKTVAENLQAALRIPTLDADSQGGAATAAISIGAATYCGKGLLPEAQLLQYAEEALAAARKTGGDKITRYDPMVATLRPAPYAPLVQVSPQAADLAAVAGK